MRLLITGSTGFIGARVLELALERGELVCTLTRNSETVKSAPKRHANIVIAQGSLESPDWRIIEEFGPDVCLHAAWISTPGQYLDSPLNENFRDWTWELARRLQQFGVMHQLFLGTCIEYKMTGAPLREESETAPASFYAQMKNDLRRKLASDPDLWPHTTWGRVFYPYGPGEHPLRLCSSLIQKLKGGEPAFLKTPQSTKDYIFIDDLAEAILTACSRGPQQLLNFGTGIGVTVLSIARAIAQQLGRSNLIQVPTRSNDDPLDFVVANSDKLTALGWKARTPLEDGLRQLVEKLKQ